MTTRLTLVCHAPTAANRTAMFPADEPLDPAGRKLLASIPRDLGGADRCLTSPALRARQTAEGLNLTAVADPLLDECGYGRWSGCSLDDLQAREPEGVAQWLTDPMAAPHGGESTAQLIARVGGWLGDQTGLTGTLVAITHASVIRAAIVHALGADPRAFWRIDIAPLSISMLSGHAGRWNLSAISPAGMFQGPPSVSGAAGN